MGSRNAKAWKIGGGIERGRRGDGEGFRAFGFAELRPPNRESVAATLRPGSDTTLPVGGTVGLKLYKRCGVWFNKMIFLWP